MIIVALCHDDPEANARRPALFDAHVAHVQSLGPALRLAAPLSLRDDASLAGAHLHASILVVEGTDSTALMAQIDGDPYASGGVWSALDYNVVEPLQAEVREGFLSFSPGTRYYVAFGRGVLLDRRAEPPQAKHAATIWTARLSSLPGNPRRAATPWSQMILIRASDLQQAQAEALRHSADVALYSIPAAIGTWVKST